MVGRVDPVEALEAGEVAVVGADAGAMLEGECRQVGIRDHVSPQTTVSKESAEDYAVVITSGRHPCQVGIEPVGDKAPGTLWRQGIQRRARVRGDALEREQGCPREPDSFEAIQSLVKPCPCGGVEL